MDPRRPGHKVAEFLRRTRRRLRLPWFLRGNPPPSLRGPDEETAAAAVRYCQNPAILQPGNSLTLLRDGKEAFPAMLSAIAAARQTIVLESYIFLSDATGREFAHALIARAAQGVRVLVIYDAVGSLGADKSLFASMREAGVQILEYHPITVWRKIWTWWRRDHRKLLVVDACVGFTGGINICDMDADPAERKGGGGWRDTHVRVEGPAARDLLRIFLSTWRREKGPPVDERLFFSRETGADGNQLVAVLASSAFPFGHPIHQAYRFAIKAAQASISITNAYFIPTRVVAKALRKAAKRGVSVRLLLPAHSDVPPVLYATRRLYAKFLRDGVKIYEWDGPFLHAKTAVVDGMWSTIGSFNMDWRSINRNIELNLTIVDKGFGASVDAMFAEDLSRAHEITLDAWNARSWTERCLERLFYALRHWL